MTVTVEQLAAYSGADAERDAEELTRALALADALVGQALSNPWREVPPIIYDQCVLDTGANIMNRGGTNASGMFSSADGTGVPGVANDPLRKSWPLIQRYVNRV